MITLEEVNEILQGKSDEEKHQWIMVRKSGYRNWRCATANFPFYFHDGKVKQTKITKGKPQRKTK